MAFKCSLIYKQLMLLSEFQPWLVNVKSSSYEYYQVYHWTDSDLTRPGFKSAVYVREIWPALVVAAEDSIENFPQWADVVEVIQNDH